jgi:hypothetical protein
MHRVPLALSVFLLTLLVAADASPGCTDCDGDGHAWPADCNDADAGSYPGATETCDGFDNDCDGLVDESPPCDSTCDTPAEIADDLRLTAETGLAAVPSVAWYGGGYGLAWADRRYGIYDQIYFARLSGLGAKLGAEVPITFNAAYSVQPSLIWTGTEHGLVFARDGQVWFARIDSAGNKIGLDVQVTTLGNPAQYPDLVWTGSEYGVAWRDSRDGNDEIYFARLDDAGAKIGGDVRVTSDTGQSDGPRLVWAGGEYGIAWADDRDGNEEIYFARLDGAGTKLTADIRVTSDAAVSQTPDLAWTGTEYGLVWRDRRDGNGEIYFALLTAAGAQVGSDVRITNAAGNSGLPRVQWTGGVYGVTWRDRRDGNNEIYFAHLDGLGLKIGSDLRVTTDAADSDEPAMIWTGSAFGIVWADDRDGDEEIYFSRVSCACGPDLDGDGFTACDLECDDGNPDTYPGAPEICDGFNNDCSDPLWPAVPADEIDRDGDTISICDGDCNDAEGQVYPGAPEICDGLNNDCDHPNWPSLIGTNDWDHDGDALSVCAGDCDDTSACTYPGAAPADNAGACMKDCDLDDYGDLAPPAGVEAGTDCSDEAGTVYPGAPAVACDGLNNDCSDPGWPTPAASESDDDGDSLAECAGDCDDSEPDVYPGAPQICDGLNNDCEHPEWPALTGTEEIEDWDGDGYTGCQDDCDLLDAAANPGLAEVCDGVDNDCDGVVDDLSECDNTCELPDRVVPAVRITDQPGDSILPAVVSNGGGFAVAWSDERDLNFEIYFALLDSAGQKIGGDRRITVDDGRSFLPDLAWSGTEYGVAWSDSRDTGSIGDEEIYFARVDAGGNKIGSDLRITDAVGDSQEPALVWTGSNYGLAWVDDRDGDFEIYFNRLSAGGTKLGTDLLVASSPGGAGHPDIAWTGTHFAVVWDDYLSGDYDIFLALIDVQGNLTDVIPIAEESDSALRPRIAWTGSEIGLTWIDTRNFEYREHYFVRLDGLGTPLSGDIHLSDALPRVFRVYAHDLVWTGEEYGVLWLEGFPGTDWVYFQRLDAGGSALSPVILVPEIGNHETPVMAFNGELYGVLWYDPVGADNSELYFAPVRCDCVDTDGDGQTGCGDCDDGHPDVYYGAPQICDGMNNDCAEPSWPDLPGTNEYDDDLDGLTECAGDCDDSRDRVYPGATQICDGVNNDCSETGWPSLAGTNELAECVIDVTLSLDGGMSWASDNPYSPWNLYRGDLSLFAGADPETAPSGLWTQEPGSNPLAARECAVTATTYTDASALAPGDVAFYLVTGLTGGVDSGLGRWRLTDSEGNRVNDNPCP